MDASSFSNEGDRFMHATTETLKKELQETDDDFRRLREEHQALEARLEEMVQQSLLSESNELEKKQIKLQKLHLKDRMEAILRQRLSDQADG